MRTFWIAILILAVAVAVIAWMSADKDSRRGSMLAVNTTDVTVGNAAPANQSIALPAAREAAAPAPASDVNLQSTAGALRTPAATPIPAPGSDSGSEPTNTAAAQALANELAQSSETAQDEEDLDDFLDDGSVSLPGNHDDPPAVAGDASVPLIDGTHILGGDGSAENPFEITWDLLVLASQTYQPRQGRTDIPPQIEAIDGKHIKIAGYFAIPMASADPKEVLFMLNMWDGCCIGMPPSPYDAIEVRLKDPLSGKKQFVNYGTLSGTLKVDPYVQNGWLLGMYLMEDGALDIGL